MTARWSAFPTCFTASTGRSTRYSLLFCSLYSSCYSLCSLSRSLTSLSSLFYSIHRSPYMVQASFSASCPSSPCSLSSPCFSLSSLSRSLSSHSSSLSSLSRSLFSLSCSLSSLSRSLTSLSCSQSSLSYLMYSFCTLQYCLLSILICSMHRHDLSPASLLLALQHARLPLKHPQLAVQYSLCCSQYARTWSLSNLFCSLSSLYCSMSCLICSLSSLSYSLYSIFCSFISGKLWAKISFKLRRVPSIRYISLSVPFHFQFYASFSFHFASLGILFWFASMRNKAKKTPLFRSKNIFASVSLNFTLNRKQMAHPQY